MAEVYVLTTDDVEKGMVVFSTMEAAINSIRKANAIGNPTISTRKLGTDSLATMVVVEYSGSHREVYYIDQKTVNEGPVDLEQ